MSLSGTVLNIGGSFDYILNIKTMRGILIDIGTFQLAIKVLFDPCKERSGLLMLREYWHRLVLTRFPVPTPWLAEG
jgi:hypothetical protein